MEWEVEFIPEFEAWWNSLTIDEQVDVDAVVKLLVKLGPALRRPYSGVIVTSTHANMKELIIQHAGRPYRVLYAFIRGVAQFYLSAATRPATITGMRNLFQWPIGSTTNIWLR